MDPERKRLSEGSRKQNVNPDENFRDVWNKRYLAASAQFNHLFAGDLIQRLFAITVFFVV